MSLHLSLEHAMNPPFAGAGRNINSDADTLLAAPHNAGIVRYKSRHRDLLYGLTAHFMNVLSRYLE
jgi:hypothetical protein